MTIIVGSHRGSFAVLAADTREMSNSRGVGTLQEPPGPVTHETRWVRPRVKKLAAHRTLPIAVARAGDSRGGLSLQSAVDAIDSPAEAFASLRASYASFSGGILLFLATSGDAGVQVESFMVGRERAPERRSLPRGMVERGLPHVQLQEFYAENTIAEPADDPVLYAFQLQGSVLAGIAHVDALGLARTSAAPVDASGARFVPERE
jgi:hypothetical protein